ncbi:Ank2 [Symbiodinium pilosum]|uniref:Ank2 protein n=1 Tax=Symbiodinium pilosum TaxID=2952 RepID=A0A812J8L7_SYMPI|nr:Ank2 [Symbiodinium pilosum]
MAGMVISQVLWPYMRDESVNIEERKEVFRYYGTFTSTFLTMFEVLLANWAPPARILVDNVSDWFVYVFVVYRCVVGFAVLNVVSAVFIQQTMKVAQADQELVLKQRLRSEQAYAAKMREFFDKLDTHHTGYLTWKEFSQVLRKPELRSWMATLELETYDLVNLFHMIDDGDGAITVAEFLDGAIRLRGVAKSLDLAQARTASHTGIGTLHKEIDPIVPCPHFGVGLYHLQTCCMLWPTKGGVPFPIRPIGVERPIWQVSGMCS